MRPAFFHVFAVIFVACFAVQAARAEEPPISRRDGFLLLWESMLRPIADTTVEPFVDVPAIDPAFKTLRFAKRRGLFDEEGREESEALRFRPDDPLLLETALLWLFRTRSLEPLDDAGKTVFLHTPERSDLAALASKYEINFTVKLKSLTREELLDLMRSLDGKLRTEKHEVSLYSEKFHGKGTAFGETFDMNALTAAHRSYPHNTLVRVTNLENGESVVVRINDRGPFVQGRNMDLSLASFTTIAPRSKGKIIATFERLGDATLVERCNQTRAQLRISKSVVLLSGVPHSFSLGGTLHLQSREFFVVREITYPDGTIDRNQLWISPEEGFSLKPSIAGTYSFVFGDKTGKRRTMKMEVVECGEDG